MGTTSQKTKHRRKGTPSSRYLEQLGKLDQLVAYIKSKECPAWMTAEQYAQLPATLTVRELSYTVSRRGFRTQEVTLVTTLLDLRVYPKDALADLHQSRWQIEVNLGRLKTTTPGGADGRAALQERRRHHEGTVGLHDRLQPRAFVDARISATTRRPAGPCQLH